MATQAGSLRAAPTVPQDPGGLWSSGIRGSGNRTKTPLLARLLPGATSRNCTRTEKSAKSFFAYQSIPRPPELRIDPFDNNENEPLGAWRQSARDAPVPSKTVE